MRWSIVIPVFNEAAFLPLTLTSLMLQEEPFFLVLVDNASTDLGIAMAREILQSADIPHCVLSEAVPGQVHALKTGIAQVETPLVAICDADTWYPPHYLKRAGELFDRHGPDCVAASAWLRPEDARPLRIALRRFHRLGAVRLMPRQNHTSGAAHCFRTDALRKAGGYDAAIWPYVLKDHELMHRVLQHGFQACDRELWCVSSERRADRRTVRWTLPERLAYHAMPFRLKHRFFHDWLAPRFERRGQRDTALRLRGWDSRGMVA